MTGESLPVTKYTKDLCFMGSTITRGETEGTVAYTGKLTFFGKTATMLNQAATLGNLQKILLKIMGVLVVLSLSLCAVTLIYLTVHKGIRFKCAPHPPSLLPHHLIIVAGPLTLPFVSVRTNHTPILKIPLRQLFPCLH